MREWEITWIRRGQEPTEGQFIPQPDYCRHSTYVSGMVVREIVEKHTTPVENCPFCGMPDYKTHDVHGVKTLCCKQPYSTCCPGAGNNGESG